MDTRIPRAFSRGATALVALALAAGAHGCATTGETPAAAETARPRRARPGHRAMASAMRRVWAEVSQCLPPGDHVTVSGDFDGDTGEFQADFVTAADGGPTAPAVDACVRAASERAYVRPFSEQSARFAHAFDRPRSAATGARDGDELIDPSAAFLTPAPATAWRAPAPTARDGSPAVATLLMDDAPSPIERIRREQDAFLRCYTQAQARDRTAEGEVELRVALDAAGEITRLSSRVTAAPGAAPLMELVARCVESHVRLIPFGRQRAAGGEVVVPLSFRLSSLPID